MAQPTVAEIFGNGDGSTTKQDGSFLTIDKFKMAVVGLTNSSNPLPTAEALFTAIILMAKQYLTLDNYNANIDQNIYIEDGFASLTTRGENNTSYRVNQIIINFAKPDAGSTIDPDDY